MMPPKGKTNEKGESTEEGMLEYVHLICCCLLSLFFLVSCVKIRYATSTYVTRRDNLETDHVPSFL